MQHSPSIICREHLSHDASSDRLPNAVSLFENTRSDTVETAISSLFHKIDAEYFVFSYNNKSKVSISRLVELFDDCEVLESFGFAHRENVMKKLTLNQEWLGDPSRNLEYLFLLRRR